MKCFMVKGVHNSGKTTLVTNIISGLCGMGYQVATLKNTHYPDFSMDTPGTDTALHRKAGAQVVVARGLGETDFVMDRQLPVEEILRFLNQDFLIFEGEPGISCPNLVTGKTPEDWDRRRDENTVGLLAFGSPREGEYNGLRVYDPRQELDEIMKLVLKESKEMDGKQKEQRQLKVYFDGKEVPMVPFVEAVIKASVLGIVGELKGFDENTKVRIEL